MVVIVYTVYVLMFVCFWSLQRELFAATEYGTDPVVQVG